MSALAPLAAWFRLRPLRAILAGVVGEVGFLLPFVWVDADDLPGVPGALGAVVACFVAIVAGSAAGAAVAAVGGLFFVGVAADFRGWNLIAIALWVVVAAFSGEIASRVRGAERERKELLARLQALIEASPLPIIAYDREGTVTLWSKAAERVFGWSQAEAIGSPLPIVPEDRQGEFREIRETVLGGGTVTGLEAERQRQDGSRLPVSIFNAGVPGAGGQVDEVIALVEDITERKRLEDALRLNISLLRAHSEASMDATLVVSPEGEMIFFNRRFVELWPIPDDVIESRSDEAALQSVLDKLVDPEEFLRRVQYLYDHRDEDAREEVQLKDGRTFDRYGAPVRSEDGAYLGRVWFFRDVTDERREERAARFLAEAGEIFAASLAPAETLERVTRLAVPGYADFCVVHVLGRDNTVRAAAAAAHTIESGELLRQLRPAEVSQETVDDLGLRRARLFSDLPDPLLECYASSAENAASARLLEPRSGILAPLIARGRVIGALSFGMRESARSFDERDLALAEEFARRAALAIDNARLYEREHTVAETLQRSLLPGSLPGRPGLELAARYLPAGTGMEVGGDWYDAWELPGDVLAMVIGDVAGHGVAAAAAMGQVRNALRAYAHDGYGPAEALRRLNRVVGAVEPGGMTTLVYVVVDPSSATLRLASAGHPPPLLRDENGEVSFVEGGRGVPLGVLQDADYSEVELLLGQSSTLVLFTDGLIERRGVSIEDGLERLRVAAEEVGGDLESLLDHLLSTLLEGTGPVDDIALLALAYSGRRTGGLELRLDANPQELAPLRRSLTSFLTAAEATEKEAYEITLACGEAAANAIEHAYGPGDAQFVVEMRNVDGSIDIVVRDTGRWRAQRRHGRGRGLPLMRAFMDSVDVNAAPEGTEVRMSRQLSRLDLR
jgi:PAS domain S-box-containing protein